MATAAQEGLQGVVAAATALSEVDGEAGRLTLAGYAVEDLAPRASFEEVVHLLWHGRLPSSAEHAELREALRSRRALPADTLALLRAAARERLPHMDALRMGVASLGLGARGAGGSPAALNLVAAFPALVGVYDRLLSGERPVPVRADLGHAAHALHQIWGREPSPEQARGLETYLNTVCDHGLNASTFTARVIASTGSDLVSAICGAVGALKGPLHGGAPGPALDMVFEIGRRERAEAVLREKLARGERLMGFGHRVYRAYDPRAAALRKVAESMEHKPDWLQLAIEVEDVALRVLAERHPERAIKTNVEYYAAPVLQGVGLSPDLFPATFSLARHAGWTAHALEQAENNRLIRPDVNYVGPEEREVPG
jgi:citrate synthase